MTKNFFDLKEASEYLRLSKSTLYKLTSNKKIPFYKPGNKIIYFLQDDLDAWVLRNRVDCDLQGVNEFRFLNVIEDGRK